jgi:hypothetical protein
MLPDGFPTLVESHVSSPHPTNPVPDRISNILTTRSTRSVPIDL